ncbi:unnamed protein product [Moneuplotes crassus]|uniref:EF-hand domain-containing protein n=1 Tax=Euplotes crassus TaxID=5936 RepID=A0AAD1XVB1_EUPCR|nr:unnamed protein product [Moneuplotes crassus]
MDNFSATSFYRDSSSGKRAMGKSYDGDDLLTKNLMLSIDYEIKKKRRTKKTPKAEKYRRIYKKLQFFKYFSLAVYVLLAFFEIPTWCIENEKVKDYSTCDKEVYPNSGIPKIPFLMGNILSIVLLLILVFFVLFRRTFKIISYHSKVREISLIILSIIAIVDIIIAQTLKQGPYLSRVVRVFITFIFLRSLRESVRRIILVVYDSKEIVVLIIGYNIFFGWIGTILFQGTQEGEVYFSSLSEGCWNLLILLTTANFPDIMLPAYHSHKLYCVFFVIYLIVGLFFTMNLILASFYSTYKSRVEKSLYDFVEERNEYLQKKFEQYDVQKTGKLKIKQLRSLLEDILVMTDKKDEKSQITLDRIVNTFMSKCGKDFEISLKDSQPNLHKASSFSRNNTTTITLENFIDYFDLVDVLKIQTQDVPYKKVESTKCNQFMRRLLKHPFYECVVSIIISLNFVVLLGIDITDWISELMLAQIIINFVFLFELMLIFFSYGISYALYSRNYVRLELFLQIINILTLFNFGYSGEGMGLIKTLQITIILRALRMLKLLKEVHQWKMIIHTASALLSPIYTLLFVTFMLFFFFAIIGDRLFGGKISNKEEQIFKDSSVPDIFVEMNFNDLGSSLLTLFALMVVNNWFLIVQVHVNVMGSKHARWFFIFFYFVSVVVMLNIVVAFVLDMYGSVESLYSKKQKDKEEERKLQSFFSAKSPNMSYCADEVRKALPLEEQEFQDFLVPKKTFPRRLKESKSNTNLKHQSALEEEKLINQNSLNDYFDNGVKMKITNLEDDIPYFDSKEDPVEPQSFKIPMRVNKSDEDDDEYDLKKHNSEKVLDLRARNFSFFDAENDKK